MQLFAKSAEKLDQAKERLEIEAKKKNVEINEGQGPAFDQIIQEQWS
jgi:hypothetical protein